MVVIGFGIFQTFHFGWLQLRDGLLYHVTLGRPLGVIEKQGRIHGSISRGRGGRSRKPQKVTLLRTDRRTNRPMDRPTDRPTDRQSGLKSRVS